MAEFLDRFGQQLYESQGSAVAGRRARAHRRFWALSRLKLGRRGLLIPVAVLAVAVPAVAVIAPWRPTLERTGVDQPVAVDSSPVAGSASGVLAVLRRPQTDRDRTLTAPLLTTVGAGNQIDDVQTDGVRSVASGWALVPAGSVVTGPAHTTSDMICLTDGGGIGCSPASSVGTQGITVLSASKSRTDLAGIVPDGVSGIRFTPEDGPPVRVDVTTNFYSLSVPATGHAGTIKAPSGYPGPAAIPGPPMPMRGTVEWLDSGGHVVGPTQQAIG